MGQTMVTRMRNLLLVAAILALIPARCLGEAAASDVRAIEGISVPSEFLGFRIKEIVKNGPDLGSTVAYGGVPGYVLTVFIYNPYETSDKPVPRTLDHPIAKDHFSDVIADVYQAQSAGYYRNVDLLDKFALTGPEDKLAYLCADFDLERVKENAKLRSLVCLGATRGSYLKIRISMDDFNRSNPLPLRILQSLATASDMR